MYDDSKCYFCDEMIFPIVDGKQINLNDSDAAIKGGKQIRFHTKCYLNRIKEELV